MYEASTENFVVQIRPEYLESESSPASNRFVWAYHVTIRNEGTKTAQLLRRYWRIVDGQGRQQEVRGAGVIGEQPILSPGDSFSYTSGTPLATASGFMMGSYQMVETDGESSGRLFDIAIPAFSLDSPHAAHAVH